jgi:hypothetical protein
VTCSVSAEFVWTDGKRSFNSPRKGRHLYRKARTGFNRLSPFVLLYAEHSYVLCRCGVYHSKEAEACSLCGAPLTA